MKHLIFCFMTTLMLLSFIPGQSKAAEETKTGAAVAASTDESAVAIAQIARLEEIKGMDMTTLSRSEKKELRNEVRAIKDQQDGRGRGNHDGRGGRDYNGRHHHGGVFVFGGGGILLIVLLIILL